MATKNLVVAVTVVGLAWGAAAWGAGPGASDTSPKGDRIPTFYKDLLPPRSEALPDLPQAGSNWAFFTPRLSERSSLGEGHQERGRHQKNAALAGQSRVRAF